MSNLQDLEVIAGNEEVLIVDIDIVAQAAVCTIINASLNPTTSLVSVLAANGLDLTITIPSAVTMNARHVGTILEIAWDFGNGPEKFTRVNLVGVPA
jgi:nicotinamide riboside kinase